LIKDRTLSYATAAMSALLSRETDVVLDAKLIAKLAWSVALAMEAEELRISKEISNHAARCPF